MSTLSHSSEAAQGPTPLKQSTAIWFEDGNVILQTQDTLFRMYKGILSRESPVFKDMFSMPQSSTTTQSCHSSGCPLVTIWDDPSTMELFLVALLDLTTVDEQCNIHQHISLFEVALKYQASRVLRRVLAILGHFFPDTLDGRKHYTISCDASCHVLARNPPLCDDLNDHALTSSAITRMVQAATDTGVLIFLPCAFLLTSEISTLRILSPEYDTWSMSNRLAVIKGQQELHRLARENVFRSVYSDARNMTPSCSSPEACHRARRWIMTQVEPGADNGTILFVEYVTDTLPNLCKSCMSAFWDEYSSERAKAWEELPQLFGLPSWAELRKARDDVFSDA